MATAYAILLSRQGLPLRSKDHIGLHLFVAATIALRGSLVKLKVGILLGQNMYYPCAEALETSKRRLQCLCKQVEELEDKSK